VVAVAGQIIYLLVLVELGVEVMEDLAQPVLREQQILAVVEVAEARFLGRAHQAALV
jgi:hypothetical protein